MLKGSPDSIEARSIIGGSTPVTRRTSYWKWRSPLKMFAVVEADVRAKRVETVDHRLSRSKRTSIKTKTGQLDESRWRWRRRRKGIHGCALLPLFFSLLLIGVVPFLCCLLVDARMGLEPM